MTTTHAQTLIITANTAVIDSSRSLVPEPNSAEANGLLFGRARRPCVAVVTISSRRAALFSFWRNFANLPAFMRHVNSIQVIDSLSSRWITSNPSGSTCEWDALITDETNGRMIAWSSAADSVVKHGGVVEFEDAPAGRGTEVSLSMIYEAPTESLREWIACLCNDDAGKVARHELRRFKQYIETGEVATARTRPHEGAR